MATNREIVTAIRGLANSTQKKEFARILGISESDPYFSATQQYGGYTTVELNYDTICSFKLVSTATGGFLLRVGLSASNYSLEEPLELLETDTPLSVFKRAVDLMGEKLRGTPGEGEVKAFLTSNASRYFWLVMPESSPELGRIGDECFHAEYSGRFSRVYITETTFEMRDCTERREDGELPCVYYNGLSYAPEVCVPIYHNALPFNLIDHTIPEWIARRRYQTVMVDSGLRYVNLERPSTAFFAKGLHSYSTRIETVVPEGSLFQKGKVDLYSKRDDGETPFLGWELEACSNEGLVSRDTSARDFKARLPYMVMAKSDSSIAPEGYEIVSVPATLDFWKETALADALDAMRVAPYNMRSFKHSSCGFHVHVSRAALSVLDLQKMERFMHNPANRSFLEEVAGRKSNTYQNYTDELFNGRKSLAESSGGDSTSRSTVEELSYFTYSAQAKEDLMLKQVSLADARRRYANNSWSSPEDTKLYSLFYAYCGDHVSYERLNGVSGGLFNSARSRSVPASETSSNWPTAHKAYIIALCNVSPFFRWKFDQFFDEIRDELPSITYTPAPQSAATSANDWRAGARKTKLPLGRKNSYRAARSIKGPLGKGAQRYDVLNTSNTNTVEFRLFKGTMNPVTIFRYLEFVDALTRFVASTSATDMGVSYEAFVTWIMGDAFNVTRYENLVSFLVEKQLYKREAIRRRALPVAKPEDGDLNVVPTPKPVMEGDKQAPPLYSISTLDANGVAEAASAGPMPFVDIDFDEDCDEDEEREYDEDGCECEDCLRARGEWDD